jgi:hypothetical protein
LHQAQQALVAGGQRQDAPSGGAEAALDNVERLRRQIEALSGRDGSQRNGGQGQDAGNQGRENYQTGALTRNGQPGQQGQQPGQGARGGEGGQPGQAGNGGAGDSDTRAGGAGARNGTIYGNLDTGNNARPGAARGAPAQQTPAIDTQQAIQQGVSELTQLRKEVANDPEMQRQIQELITAMEHLDLRRFPGNPAMVEELHQRLLSGVDTLELQLRRELGEKGKGQIRSADSLAAPPGYKDAVAEYYRRLSANTPSKDREKRQ